MPEREPPQILIVDDEKGVREALSRILTTAGYSCRQAAHAVEARAELREREPELLLCDVQMPGESGLDLAQRAIKEHPDMSVLMVTMIDDLVMAEAAFDIGVFGWIPKPFTPKQVLLQASNALRRRRLEMDNREYAQTLESIILERTALLTDTLTQLDAQRRGERIDESAIHRLARVLECRDKETADHTRRMSAYSRLLAGRAGLDPAIAEEIKLAAILHDIGKIAVPDSILLKPGKLTQEQFDAVKHHSETGYRILADWPGEVFKLASTIAWTHHERWDGAGYPRGLAGEEIPFVGRIVSIADVFDALTSDRPYRLALSDDEAFEIMTHERGQFDLDLLHAFVDARDDVVGIMQSFAA